MVIKIGDRVKLISYNGTLAPTANCDPGENYWQLLGCEGVVVKDPFTCAKYPDKKLSYERRVLVKFDLRLSSLSLIDSNNAEDCLWVGVTDLKCI